MRLHGLNPRAPAVPAKTAAAAAPAGPPLRQHATPATAASAGDSETPAEMVARAGGFHESSYELQHGLLISESSGLTM